MLVLMEEREMLGYLPSHFLGIVFQNLLYSHQQHLFPEHSIVILGDEAFKLTATFMRLYPHDQAKADTDKAVYNYQHCVARRTSKNVFGILCQYFITFFTSIVVDLDTTVLTVLAACVVYSFLIDERSLSSCDETPFDVIPST